MGAGVVDSEAFLKLFEETTDFVEKFAPSKAHVHTAESLAAAGADSGLVGSLSDDDMARFGNEILWLAWESTNATEKDAATPMSKHLAERLGQQAG